MRLLMALPPNQQISCIIRLDKLAEGRMDADLLRL